MADYETFRGGAGEPLVLIHGITGSWRNWEPVIPLLTPDHRVLAPTLPGHRGGPPMPAGPATLAAVVDGAEQFLDQESLDRAHLVGNSLGGMVGVELVRRGRARSLTILNGPAAWKPGSVRPVARTFRMLQAASRTPVPGLLARHPWGRKALFAVMMKHGERATLAQVRDALEDSKACTMALALIHEIARRDRLDPLELDGVPTTVAWSRDDRLLTWPRFGGPTVAHLRGARHVRLDGTGHVPMFDDPELVASVIRETVAAATD